MQSRAARLGLLAAVIVAAIVVFVVLKNNNSDTSNDTAKGVQVLNVDASGNPVGGVKTLTYNKGDQVQLHVNLAAARGRGPRPRLRDREAGRAQPGHVLVPGEPRRGVRDRGASLSTRPRGRSPSSTSTRDEASRLKLAVGLALATPIAALLFPDVASAHALVGRKDLPVPAWLFAWGASLVLIISFALLSVAWTDARLQDEDWRAMPRWFSRAVAQRGDADRLRADRRRALRAGPLRRLQGHRGPDPELRDHLRLLHVLAGPGPGQRPVRGRLPGLQPVAGDRPDDLGRFSPGRGGVRADAVHLSGAARPLAGGGRRAARSSGSS